MVNDGQGAADEPSDESVSAEGSHELPAVPPDVSERLRRVFGERRPVVEAQLVTDTSVEPVTTRTRSGGVAAWTMAYAAHGCDVILDIAPIGRNLRLTGQVLTVDQAEDTIVRVFDDDELVAASSTDDVGQFEVGLLAPRNYTVSATTKAIRFEMAVDLRPSAR